MERKRLPFSASKLITLIFAIFFHETIKAKKQDCVSSCGDIPQISYPFRLQADPNHCGEQRYTLFCENNLTILHLYSGKYVVQEINYTSTIIRIKDIGIQKNNCSSIPHYSLSHSNFSYVADEPYRPERVIKGQNVCYSPGPLSQSVIFLGCHNQVKSNPVYIDTSPCDIFSEFEHLNPFLGKPRKYIYVVVGRYLSVSNFEDSCGVERMVLIRSSENYYQEVRSSNISYMDIHNELSYGFEITWYSTSSLGECHVTCPFGLPLSFCIFMDHVLWYTRVNGKRVSGLILIVGSLLATRTVVGTLCVIVFLFYKWTTRHLSMYHNIEEFLRSQNNFMPIRYSYYEIKKMTKGFKDKLGEGGCGSVYKGKLSSGRMVAIKILGKSNSNGQDFINEVATIGRIHHANVVRLIGFCVERSKRALVYDFMPNGSLDKYIFRQEGTELLGCKMMFEISLGVACGIEYLHQGCEIQILHFDIKPHNILLDENFVPKISDFGLARLCPLDKSIVSLTAARGTIGYIAPELFYKNIGGVSDKADIYSFGMLLMEMASRRKNFSTIVESSNQAYFPSWVYNQIKEEKDIYEHYKDGTDVEIGEVKDEEAKLTKKMIVVALWCIQFKPSDRPSIDKVKEMLEGEVECLEMPPKPFLYPQENSLENASEQSDSTWSSTITDSDSTKISSSLDAACDNIETM